MAMISTDKLHKLAPSFRGQALDELHSALVSAMLEFNIVTSRRAAAFLAQTAHESMGFVRTVENLNYSSQGLMKTWPSRFKTRALADQYARQPQKIANYVYANRLGNGTWASGDGWQYRGRGFIMTTGKANYESVGHALGLSLVQNPALLELTINAARSAGYFWASHGLNAMMDDSDQETAFVAATRAINGGLNGLADRRERWALAKEVLCVQ